MKILFKAKFATECPQRASVSTYRGNSVEFVADIFNYSVAAQLSDDTVKAYYQPLDGDYSDSLFAFEEVSASGNTVIAKWLPSYDVGAKKYRIILECTDLDGASYPALFEMSMLENPVYELSPTNPPQKKILDFGKFELVNAPWVEIPSFTEALDDVNDSLDEIKTKIDNISVDVDAIDIPTDYAKQATLLNGISSISSKIDNIDIDIDFTSIDTQLAAIQDSVDAIDIPTNYATTTQISGLQNDLDDISGAIATRASQTSLNLVAGNVTTINTKVDTLATQTSVNAIKTVVDSNATSINAKASQASVDSISTTLGTKASQASVNTLTTTVNSHTTTLSNHTTALSNLDTKLGEVSDALDAILGV